MSRAPYVMSKAEAPFGRDMRMFDSTIGARFPNPKVEGRYGGDTMPETADNLARDYQITREEADVFAAGSQSKYAAAKADGFYADEIIAVEVPGGRAGPVSVAEDEHPRPQTDMAALAKLRPLFKDGVTRPATRPAPGRSPASCRARSPGSSRASWASARCRRRKRRSSAPV
jgi:acetyl-CoA C-acetyltransferase